MRTLKVYVCLVFILAVAGFELMKGDARVAGQRTLTPPTNMTATDNLYNNKVGIFWDVMRDATTYRIFRSTVNDNSTAFDIGNTPAPFFFDNGATPNTTFFYWVRAENSSTVSAMSLADSGSRTNNVQPPPGAAPPLNPPPPAPVGNNLTGAKAYLGKVLFWDEQMSSTRTVSCGTCHHSATGGTDPRVLSTNAGPDAMFATADDIHGSAGVPSNNVDGTYLSFAPYGLNDQVTGRKTVSYVNAAYSPVLFWDGRATGNFTDPVSGATLLTAGAALESQSAGPPVSSAEMGNTGRAWTDVANRIAVSKPLILSPSIPAPLKSWINNRTYPELFQEAFGSPDVTPSRIAFAMASFERTLFSDQAPVDLDAAGITPLNLAAQRGRGVFNQSGCNTCHGGPTFSDNQFHFIGVRPPLEDTGRFGQTGANQDIGAFRTPSLRNASLRTSFFHNGGVTTLPDVVEFYNRGGDFTAPNKPPTIRPLNLTLQQKTDLVAFLQSLTDPRVAAESGPFSRPTLYMESTRVPQVVGTGRSGTSGLTPQIKAIAPPLVGNPNFTVSVSNALGNANATLVIDAVDPGVPATIPSTGSFARVTTSTQSTGSGIGWTSLSLPIPDNPSLVGKTLFARWYIEDPSAANGFAVSQVAQFTLFGTVVAAPTAAAVSISGRVMTSDGRGIRGVVMTLIDMKGQPRTAVTGALGTYHFDEVISGQSYILTVTGKRFTFADPTKALTATDNLTGVDFVGTDGTRPPIIVTNSKMSNQPQPVRKR